MTTTNEVLVINKASGRTLTSGDPANKDLREQLNRLGSALERALERLKTTLGGPSVEVSDALPAWMTEQRYAVPTPWDARHEEAGPDQDGAARGDEQIVARRTEQELRREIQDAEKKVRHAITADRPKATAKLAALKRELDAMLHVERDERVRRNYGSDGLGGASPMGAQQYAEPVSWDATQAVEGAREVPTLEPMSDAEAERLRAESIRLQATIKDTQSPFTERREAQLKLAKIDAELRAAGRSIELGRAGGPRPQP